MFENPRRGSKARNFTTNVPKILDLKSSSEQIFSENWRWVPLITEETRKLSTKIQVQPWSENIRWKQENMDKIQTNLNPLNETKTKLKRWDRS